MKRIACIVLACATVSTGAAKAQPPYKDRGFMLYGPTGVSCGKFAAVKGHEHELYEWWALGVVSGAGLFWSVELSRSDSEGILGWIDKYCVEHPIDTLMVATTALVRELADRELIR